MRSSLLLFRELFEQGDFVEAVISIGVFTDKARVPCEPLNWLRHRDVPSVDQALCMPDVQINTLYPGRIHAQGPRCDVTEPSILGNDEAAFVIMAC